MPQHIFFPLPAEMHSSLRGATIRLFRHADLSACVTPEHGLAHHNFNLPYLHDTLFGVGASIGHLWSSASLNIGADHFKGVGSSLGLSPTHAPQNMPSATVPSAALALSLDATP